MDEKLFEELRKKLIHFRTSPWNVRGLVLLILNTWLADNYEEVIKLTKKQQAFVTAMMPPGYYFDGINIKRYRR